MQVTSATDKSTNVTSSTANSSTTSATTVDYDTFLKLLVAEMKNQDPTDPTDPTEYMAQFAQFSTVEQAIQTNTKLDSLLSASALAQADGLIGRTASFIATDGTEVSSEIIGVNIITGGATATLADGTSVLLGPGVTIS